MLYGVHCWMCLISSNGLMKAVLIHHTNYEWRLSTLFIGLKVYNNPDFKLRTIVFIDDSFLKEF